MVAFLLLAAGLSLHGQAPAGSVGGVGIKQSGGRLVTLMSSNTLTAECQLMPGSSTGSEVLARDVTIPGKGFQSFSSSRDFGGAGRVTISITTLETGTYLTNVRIGAAWAVMDVQESWFILTDVIKGSSFAFTDHGGANVPVGGEALKIVVWNDGVDPVTIRQLNVYSSKEDM